MLLSSGCWREDVISGVGFAAADCVFTTGALSQLAAAVGFAAAGALAAGSLANFEGAADGAAAGPPATGIPNRAARFLAASSAALLRSSVDLVFDCLPLLSLSPEAAGAGAEAADWAGATALGALPVAAAAEAALLVSSDFFAILATGATVLSTGELLGTAGFGAFCAASDGARAEAAARFTPTVAAPALSTAAAGITEGTDAGCALDTAPAPAAETSAPAESALRPVTAAGCRFIVINDWSVPFAAAAAVTLRFFKMFAAVAVDVVLDDAAAEGASLRWIASSCAAGAVDAAGDGCGRLIVTPPPSGGNDDTVADVIGESNGLLTALRIGNEDPENEVAGAAA